MSGKVSALMSMTIRQLNALSEEVLGSPCCPVDVRIREQSVTDFQRSKNLATDGWPGSKTYEALWAAGHWPVSRERISEIAVSMCNLDTKYVLGRGGYTWLCDFPDSELDCSGFVACVLGRSRRPASDFPYWLSTDSIWNDCAGDQLLFIEIPEPLSGCLVVYPDSGGRQGHVAVVTSVDQNGDIYGVDCSSSRSSATGQAVTQRSLSFFLSKPGVRFCLPNWVKAQ